MIQIRMQQGLSQDAQIIRQEVFPASIKKGTPPAVSCQPLTAVLSSNIKLQTIFFYKLSFPGLRAIYPCRPVLFSVQFSVQNSTSSQRNEKIA